MAARANNQIVEALATMANLMARDNDPGGMMRRDWSAL
ncbi:hypothetical protein A2U01_0065534 [Trifolium medium]|uniref:Uncharacterized protein n=1 Tax=Trifolium medium TaxID=97028 RepID=A0A392S8S6_9FABA|nr:hypothetical protein [Trifolium medium]